MSILSIICFVPYWLFLSIDEVFFVSLLIFLFINDLVLFYYSSLLFLDDLFSFFYPLVPATYFVIDCLFFDTFYLSWITTIYSLLFIFFFESFLSTFLQVLLSFLSTQRHWERHPIIFCRSSHGFLSFLLRKQQFLRLHLFLILCNLF